MGSTTRVTTSATSKPLTSVDGRRREPRSGYTLIELLIVLLIVASLSGMGLGFLMKREGSLDREVARLRDLARSARALAQFTRSPAVVEIVPPPWVDAGEERRKVQVFAQRRIGEWNFDRGRADGSGGLGGELGAGRIAPGGRFGEALWIDGDAEGHGLRFDVRTLPTFDLHAGFLCRCDVFLEEVDACVAVRIGESFELGVGQSGVLSAFVTLTRDDGSAGRRVTLTGRERLRPRRWYRLSIEAAHGEAVLALDGIAEAREDIDAPIWRDKAGWFVVSDGAKPVFGAVDTVSLFGLELSAEELFDEDLLVEGPRRLAFDEAGFLDRRSHPEPAGFSFTLGEQKGSLVFEREGLTR